jgi:hypothetical protein
VGAGRTSVVVMNGAPSGLCTRHRGR